MIELKGHRNTKGTTGVSESGCQETENNSSLRTEDQWQV